MARKNVLQVQLNGEQMLDLEERASEAGMKVAAFARSLMFPTEAQITTGDKLPVPKRKANSKLCRSCAKAGVAAWNCRQCSPHAAKQEPVKEGAA